MVLFCSGPDFFETTAVRAMVYYLYDVFVHLSAFVKYFSHSIVPYLNFQLCKKTNDVIIQLLAVVLSQLSSRFRTHKRKKRKI